MRFMPHDVSDFQILRKIKSRAVNGYRQISSIAVIFSCKDKLSIIVSIVIRSLRERRV